jgi:GTP-binding protein Era
MLTSNGGQASIDTSGGGFKSGYVAIVGKPNVGKSTILNRLVGEKIAIVSPKPQTTRSRILGILTTVRAQIVFLDTPGIHKPHVLLGKAMVRAAQQSLFESDLILFTTDVTTGLDEEDQIIFRLLSDVKNPVILLINKIDAVSKSRILPLIDEASKIREFKEVIPVSATGGENMNLLLERIIDYLPEGPKYYPDDQLTDKTERFLVSELIRERVLKFMYQEVPYSVAVYVTDMKERPGRDVVYISATIYVERDSQKGILIGHKGEMLKKIGQLSRQEIEEMLKKKVYIELWVKVLKDWRKDERALQMLGYL